jgi:lipopolysaccharide transport system permease protein
MRPMDSQDVPMSLTAAPTSAPLPAPSAELEPDVPIIEIRPRSGWIAVDFHELWHHRELLLFLIWRDVKVRYKQTILGFAWAILQPVITMVIFTGVFGGMADMADKVPDELKALHIPYRLFVYAGLLPWMFFSVGVGTGGTSLMNQQNLLTKVYFPRLFVPTSVIGAALVDTLISFAVFFVLMFSAGIVPPWTVVLIPFLLLLTMLAAMGAAYTLSALTVTYRDFRILLPFIVQSWMFVSPVAYPLQPHSRLMLSVLRLNPLYGIINAYRSALLGQHWDLNSLGISIVEVAILLLFGLFYFKKTERRFADIA